MKSKTRTFIVISVIALLMTGIASASFDDVAKEATERAKDSAETYGSSSDSGMSLVYVLISIVIILVAIVAYMLMRESVQSLPARTQKK